MICGAVELQAAMRMHRSSAKTQELVLQPQDTGTFIISQWSLQCRARLQTVLWGCALLRNQYRCKVGLVMQTCMEG